MACCDSLNHPWDQFSVMETWLPTHLRCLIIGESPGSDPEKYFYNEHRTVAIRTIMLRELHRHGLIKRPSLERFRDAGFLFDHAIRCLLPSQTILHEAKLAGRYMSSRAADAAHLEPFLNIQSPVWLMGRIARNAVVTPRSEFPKDTTGISQYPNPRWIKEAPRFFVSRYLLHASREQVSQIFAALHRGLDTDQALHRNNALFPSLGI